MACHALGLVEFTLKGASIIKWAAVFSKLLLAEAQVAVSPGLGFGEYGDGFVRIALVENRQRIRQAARNVRQFFVDADKILERAETRAAAR